MKVKIRQAAKGDLSAIRYVNRRAFDRGEEARLGDDLRGEGYARLSLVAEEDGRIAGHSHPGYYPRFGFSADLAGNLSSAHSGEAFMALELVPGALAGMTGEFEFAPPFEAVS